MATTTGIAAPRRGRTNLITGRDGRPLLVIVEGHDIDPMVDAGLEAIGGLGRVIRGFPEVLLKPNTNQRDPYPSITAPETLRAVARHCRAAGARRIAVHEDHKFELDLYYDPAELPGMDLLVSQAQDPDDYVLVEDGAWWDERDLDLALRSAEPERMVARLRDPGFRRTDGPRLRVARPVHAAPVVINMPVLKRHFAGQITSALKNNFGSVYGGHRWVAHSTLESDRDYFDRKLVEFADTVRPEITITDVRSLQAVSGPSRDEETRIVEGVNRLIVTGDMVAADVVAVRLMRRHDDTFTPANEAIIRRQHQHAEALGLGTSDLSRFEVIELKV